MEGFVQFAQNTVKTVSEILPFPISVSDEQGYIIGDTNPLRIGTIHTPSIEVIKANKVILFTEEKTIHMDNVLPGVAVPLNFENKPVGVLGIIGNPQEVESYAYLVKKYVEMMWQETLHVQIENLEAMTLESFVQYILLNEPINHEQISHYCELLHIEPNWKRTCIVIDIGDYLLKNMQDKHGHIPPERMKKTILDCIVRAFSGNQQDICAFLNTERIVFLKCTNSEEDFQKFMNDFRNCSIHLLEMFQVYKLSDVIIASGNICSSLDHVAQSYWEADSLIKFSHESMITPKIYSYFDWDILIEMLPHQLGLNMQKILVQRLKPLINDDAFSQLKHDFITYCNNNMNISKAAEDLFIHRNTLIYRLKKINNITGLDTSCFEHCTLLYFVLK
ncbi:CdaR family transcriptional regulator [Virgibacillus salinus]|uniref:Transcriptional regulator, CdaR family n=1 Tax=Virgibacillus salinus TaxID=553311 RepID=A0A1H0YX83_9BACI|nr:sugar diacid recognition domain-containing protein [Virgibacillus salinus]SDQ19809.1 transcriptional regulator, CdaR family [Virgibacillus salinus]